MTDKDVWKLNRGGHDPHKVYAAYHAGNAKYQGSTNSNYCKNHVKGYGMGKSGESINTTHQTEEIRCRMIYYIIEIDLMCHLTDKQVKKC